MFVAQVFQKAFYWAYLHIDLLGVTFYVCYLIFQRIQLFPRALR